MRNVGRWAGGGAATFSAGRVTMSTPTTPIGVRCSCEPQSKSKTVETKDSFEGNGRSKAIVPVLVRPDPQQLLNGLGAHSPKVSQTETCMHRTIVVPIPGELLDPLATRS